MNFAILEKHSIWTLNSSITATRTLTGTPYLVTFLKLQLLRTLYMTWTRKNNAVNSIDCLDV